jgi:hypothetical protein
MSYLVNRIIQNMVFKENGGLNDKFKEKAFVQNVRTIVIETVILKVCLTKKDFWDIKHKLEEDEKT